MRLTAVFHLKGADCFHPHLVNPADIVVLFYVYHEHLETLNLPKEVQGLILIQIWLLHNTK